MMALRTYSRHSSPLLDPGWVQGNVDMDGKGDSHLLTDVALWPTGLIVGFFVHVGLEPGGIIIPVVTAGFLAGLVQCLVGLANGAYRWRSASFGRLGALSDAWLAATLAVVIANNTIGSGATRLPALDLTIGAAVAALGMGISRWWHRHRWSGRCRVTPEGVDGFAVSGASEGHWLFISSVPLDQELTCSASICSGGSTKPILTEQLPGASIGAPAKDLHPIEIDDVLGRDPVEIDLDSVSDYVRDRRVLVTGAGGSIGSELARQLHKLGPAVLVLLDRDETGLHGVQLSIEGRALLDTETLVVADIRDRCRVFELFDRWRPEVVFHAAALKHLSLLQIHHAEAVKTNTLGTANLLDAAEKFGVERFVNVSTDKAADPSSVLGATKLAAERLTAAASNRGDRRYVSVRFGNVLGSRGSVLPTFLEQIRQGQPLTVTDASATRYFMTISEAVRLIVQAGAIGEGGEVMILDMGEPVKILDLAKQLIARLDPSATIEFTGLRPGEKLHEALVAKDEVGVRRVHPRISHTMLASTNPLEAIAGAVDRAAFEVARDQLAMYDNWSRDDLVKPNLDTEENSYA